MDATQMISDSILESDEEENEELNETKRGRPLAKLCILKNQHIPETELPLFLGDNVLGRDPNTCTLLMPAPSISKQHATICISVYKKRGSRSDVDIEALVWDLGSMNGTRKGRLKLTPNVRYALSECDSLVMADITCQYVSCTGDAVSSQRDVGTPVSRNSGARLPDASEEKRGDTGTGSKKCVNGGTKARVSLPDQKDTKKTPVRASCLSFEQTPTQPQGTLVPESDSESDGEGGDKRSKARVSDSDSHKSSPVCSTFLSPTNKIVPESEDESPITPSSSTKNRPCRHVSFSQEEMDVDVGRQQLKNKKTLAIVGDGEEKEERAALGGRKYEESGHVPLKQESNVSLGGEVEFPVSTPAAFTNAIPAFGMDSDTDMEGEEEGVASAGPVTLNTNQQAVQLPNTAQFHMDSDTDVDEDDEVSHTVPKSVPSSADHIKPPHVISVIQPEGITLDSDTDVDDDDDDDDDDDAAAAVSDTAIKAKPSSLQSTHTADSSTQLNDLHRDRQMDVDDEEKECGTNNACSKVDEISTRSDKPTEPESTPAAPHGLHLDSDTDDEAVPASAISEPSVVSAVTELTSAADAAVALGVLSDSDTDVENDFPLAIPVAASTVSVGPGTMSQALQSDSNADTDVDESSVPPAGEVVNPTDLRLDRDTDVEDEVAFGEADDGQIPSLRRENTPGLLVPLQHNCSTPVQQSERELENMETQVFLCPSSRSFRGPIPPAAGAIALSSCSDSQEDDFIVAETQSFILQTRECHGNPPANHSMDPTQSSGDEKGELSIRGRSFQLGLSDSSHLEAQALAMESTQAFVVGGLNLEDTQVYAAVSNADRNPLEKDLHLEAYGEDKELARSSVMSAKEGRVDLALEATQAYISEPYSDSEDENYADDADGRKNTATAETQPFDFPTSSILAIAETQPMSAFEEESLDKENPISSALQVKPRPPNVTEEREEHGEAAQPLKRHLSVALSVAGTQLTNSEFSLVETQPMTASGDVENYGGDSIAGPRKRKAKPLWFEDEQTQALTDSELPTVGTWPTHTGEDGESEEEDSILSPRKRRAKPLRLEDETQPLTSSDEVLAVETQPMGTCEGKQGDEEDSIPGPRKRKAKALQLEEEETEPLVSAVVTQPLVAVEDRDSIPGPRKRKAKAQQEEEETKTCLQPQRGKGRLSEAETSGTTIGGRRKTRARFREEEEQAECSEPPKRQTRGKTKALPTTRGRRGKLRPDDDEESEEQVIEQPKQARGKKSTRQQKDEEEERLERRKHIENNDRLKEQEEECREEQAKLEREVKENEEQEVQAENAEGLRLEQERIERERMEEKKRADRAQKEKEKQLERERKEMEEKERLERERADREEKDRKEKEEKERLERERADREEKERKEMEEKERLEHERRDREAKERIEKEREEEEEKERERADREDRERKEKEEKERLKKAKRDANETQTKEQQENKPKTLARGRRAARRTFGDPVTSEPERDSAVTADDDVPARRTRSRSNSSNSVSSERSASSVNTQGSRGRGRARGAKRTSGPQQNNNDISPQGVLSRSNSEISTCSLSSQSRGRGGRQRGRGRKSEAEPDYIPPTSCQRGQNVSPKPPARGRRSRKAEESSNEVSHEGDVEKADAQQASTTRGPQLANANGSEPAAADKKAPSSQECGSEEPPLSKRTVRGRGQKAVKSEPVEVPIAPSVSDGDECKEKRKVRKRELEASTEEGASSSSKISKEKAKAQTTEAVEEEPGETKDEIRVQAKRRGRVSSAQAKLNPKDPPTEFEVKKEGEKMKEGTVERRGRGRPSVVQKKKKEEQDESVTSVDQDPHVQPQTPTGGASRKRQAPANSSCLAKTPRSSSSASPTASGRLRAASQAHKVLFTGVVDEEGERALARLGGNMAKGVADMNCLVTDKVRRTVKFLCAVAKGVPIVTTHWLQQSGKAGSFLPPDAFVVKDPEQEKKFNFCLQESLRIASSQPLLQGYEIHVTKSVQPEPVHMKDIISCSGATFLAKMPSCHKPQTVVISCEDDWLLCRPALSASLPVFTAEFILTGILQQKLDFQTNTLSSPANTLQPAGGRGGSRKKM